MPLLRGKARVQPVLREFDAHAHDVRDRRQATVRRRDQPQHRRLVDGKGETLLDTVDNLCAMNADMFVVRHSQSGAPHLIASHLDAMDRSHVHVVNAGDGRHAHPTQGLLDLFTIRHYKRDFRELTVAIVGDVLHSRVARSLIHGLTTMQTPEVRVIAPRDAAADARRGAGRAGPSRHARGLARLRRRRDAAAAERADEGRAAARRRASTSSTTD